jgi:hypothetical protein
VSSMLFMIEVQDKWWKPNLRTLGWHIGFWNLVGAIGFTLCGALGFGVEHPGVEYALTLSTFVGSWAFLVIISLLPIFSKLAATGIQSYQNSRLAVLYNGMRASTSILSMSIVTFRKWTSRGRRPVEAGARSESTKVDSQAVIVFETNGMQYPPEEFGTDDSLHGLFSPL